ncbi:MAG TPA: LysM peptidoglycan-binding domain-containing protein [Thermoanaerobaculia bacterium]|nr:LysM peptidoglycan-binding domain-containing protein [Thermoanaerobaculia bacterium]
MKRILLAVLLLSAVRIAADDTIGWHVVQPGETLSRITVKYLGSSADWRDNWKLNPGIADPNKLKPGQRVRVILSRTLPARSALVNRVARRVEKKPEPAPWTTARAGDQLGERNGIRTYEASSAELKFEDNTLLTLTERSLVFLRGTQTAATNRATNEIEIVDGHADLEQPANKPAPSNASRDIEIFVGTTTAKPVGGAAKARFRKEGTAAQVMSYRGAASVASAGASVNVGEGMGVAVPEGKKPPKPERLLVAPALSPVDAASPRPTIRWSAVEGALRYTAEVCRDASCAEIVAREASVETTEWQPPALDAGDYVVRVSARSASGLDGFPSVAPLRVRRALIDVTDEGTLRAAIETANASRGAYEIRLRTSVTLTAPLPRITVPLTISGSASTMPIGSVTTVGLAQTTLLNPTRSDVAIDFGGAAVGFDAADSLILRELTLTGAATHVRAAAALSMENVVVGTLLARAEATGIETRGATLLRRVLVTGMLQAGIVARGTSRIDAEFLEISNSGDGLVVESAGSRIRHSLFLLNQTGAALAEGSAIESSTFRGNRTARALPTRVVADVENTFDDNLITAVVAGRVTKIRVNEAGATVVSGTAAPGVTVEIYSDTAEPARVVAGADGAFSATLQRR